MRKIDLKELYSSAYSSFSQHMRESVFSPTTNHKWYNTPELVSGNWMLYFLMLNDFARNLSNTINVFGYNIEKLRTWHAVVMDLDEDKRDQVLFEFVDDLFVIVMHTPHTTRDRFIFFGTQLSHMANRCFQGVWADDLPEDYKIRIEHLRAKCSTWSSGDAFVKCVELLNSNEYVNASKSYRNRFQHQLPSQELIGVASYVSRVKADSGGWEYRLMQQNKIDLSRLSDRLEGEFKLQVSAYAAFTRMIDGQLEKILNR